jgi:tetratricopeptide (TPR) repeat protein
MSGEMIMGLTDRFGLPITTSSADAAADYIAAVDLLLSANVGADELLERAIAADPEFALAHIARARLLQLRARIPEAKAAVARAKSLCDGVTARERRHTDTIALAVGGAATEALAMVRAHSSEYPRDALPLSLALGVFGLLGFSGRRDHHEAQLALLKELAPHWGDDWWFFGYLGWAYIETGEVAAGTRLVERSLAGYPRNAHAAHQRVHGFFESGDATGGAGFIENWADRLRPSRPAALPSVVALGPARARSRQQRARPCDLPRQHKAFGGASGADAGSCRLGIVSVALAVLRCGAAA